MNTSNSFPIHGAPLASLPALLKAWNHHQDLRSGGATVSELAASRGVLDLLRATR